MALWQDASSSAMLDESASALSSSMFFPWRGARRETEPARLAQLASSFALRDVEVAFFNAVIRHLPPASTSFSELKHAYNVCRQDAALVAPIMHDFRASYTPEAQASIDARLWNTLLSLVQVRGHTWAERWDTIRVGLGLEPLDDESSFSVDTRAPVVLSSTPWKPATRRPHFERRWDTYRRRVQRRYLYQWLARTQHLAHMYARAEHTRERVSVWTAWVHWRDARERHVQSVREADAMHRTMLTRASWTSWRLAVGHRHAQRRDAQHRALAVGWHTWHAKKCDRLQRIAWTLWQHAWLARTATAIDTFRALASAWHAWRARMERLAHLSPKASLFSRYLTQRLASRAWVAWRLRLGERRSDAHDMLLAARLRAHHALRRAWGMWRTSLAQHLVRHHHGRQVSQRVDERVRHAAWMTWRVRTQLVGIDAVRTAHSLRHAWNAWWLTYTERTMARQALVMQLTHRTHARVVRHAWHTWSRRYHAQLREERAAQGTFTWRCLYMAWHAWKARWRHVQQEWTRAEDVETHHLLRRRWRAWTQALQRRRETRAAHHYTDQLLRRVWSAWRVSYASQRHSQSCEALVLAQQHAHRQREAWRRWTSKLAAHRDRAGRACLVHDALLLRAGWGQWRTRRALCRAMEHTAVTWHETRRGSAHRQLRRAWDAWAARREHRIALQQAYALWTSARVTRAWRQWRDVYAQLCLQAPELETLALRRRAILRVCWARWTEASACVPMLRARRCHRQRLVLRRWRRATQAARHRRTARHFGLDTAGRDAWNAWRARAMYQRDTRWISYVPLYSHRRLKGRRARLSNVPRVPPRFQARCAETHGTVLPVARAAPSAQQY